MVVLAALAGLGMVVMVSVGVVMRYFLNSPLNFTEEVVGLLLSASLFLMLPYLTLHDKHVQITLLTQHPAEKIRWVLKSQAVGHLGLLLVDALRNCSLVAICHQAKPKN